MSEKRDAAEFVPVPDVPPDAPLHMGRVILFTTPKGRPVLSLKFWCPICRHSHFHKWRHDYPIEEGMAIKKGSHCKRGPFQGKDYYVTLPNGSLDHHRAIRDKMVLLHGRWEASQNSDAGTTSHRTA